MNYYNDIKTELLNNEIYKKVKDYSKNRNDLETYYNVGKLLIDAQGGEERAKYGDNLIKEYSKKLTLELGKGYSTRSLKNMRKFYLLQKGQTVSALLTWSHFCELLPLKDINKINYYIKNYNEQDLPQTTNERFATTYSLLTASNNEVRECRNFIKEHCDKDYLKVSDIYWA